jgi:hypothetical protein
VEATPSLGGVLPVGPAEAEVRAFGRIGKVNLNPPGAISVETSLKVKVGEQLWMQGAGSDPYLEVKKLYQVAEVLRENLYYRYENRLELVPVDQPSAEDWDRWLRGHKSAWTAPKTKLLWVTENYSVQRELFFDKNLFSVYVESPHGLTADALNRIAPRIVLVDERDDSAWSIIEGWRELQAGNPVLAVTPLSQAPAGWKQLSCFADQGLSPALHQELRAFLMSRISQGGRESRYLSRKSEISRVYFSIDARLTAISKRLFSFTCAVDFQIPTPVQIRLLEAGREEAEPLFGRTVQSEFLADRSGYRIFCEWLPHSDELGKVFPDYRDLLT